MLIEDLDALFSLNDLGVPVTAGEQTAVGLLDMPDQVIGNGQIITTDYALWYQTSKLTLATGDAITVNGVNYKVRAVKLESDGAISVASLSKVLP